METKPLFHPSQAKSPVAKVYRTIDYLWEKANSFLVRVKQIGINPTMDEYEQRKLSIFNQLNFLQLLAGILIPISGFLRTNHLPAGAWFVVSLPALVCTAVLYLNYKHKHEYAIITYFVLYPFVTCCIYMSGINLGTTLFFIQYGVMSVFFLKDIGYMIFSLCFSMVSYFVLAVVIKHYPYEMLTMNYALYFFNQLIAIVFIFYGLFLIKKENAGYQSLILSRNKDLQDKNEEIQYQAHRIKRNTSRLEEQAAELKELNAVKNKMFGIISHDLKAPLYGLRNIFQNVTDKKMTVTELKKNVPEIQKDMNYVVGLMDNLLQWAKVQMQHNAVQLQKIDLKRIVDDTIQQLQLQAKAKRIYVVDETPGAVYSLADRDMINLVLRNLVSNAIKFTPEFGTVTIGVVEHDSFVEVYVKDSGEGISKQALEKINNKNFHSTKGTASESGTGLGLILCKEFLERNESKLNIESEPGVGSTFSFSLHKIS
jgi:two-component system, sensor histidine kinase and response regulator